MGLAEALGGTASKVTTGATADECSTQVIAMICFIGEVFHIAALMTMVNQLLTGAGARKRPGPP